MARVVTTNDIMAALNNVEQRIIALDAKVDMNGVRLLRVLTRENNMAIDLTALTNEVANNTSVEASILQLVQNLAGAISSTPATQAALDQLVQTLQSNDAAIAAAVTANTPAPPPSPPATPTA